MRKRLGSKSKFTAGALIGLLAVPVGSMANQSQNTSLTLADAVQMSLGHSTTIQEAQSNLKAARARTGQAASRKLPQLGFSASATRFDDRTTVTLPGLNAPFQVQPDNQEALTIALTQDLDISGELGLIVSQSRLNARSAEYDVQAVTADQKLATTVAYYAVLRAEQNVRVADASLTAYKEQQTTTTRLYKGGVGQRIDVDRADSQVAEAESELVRRQNEVDSARSTLNDLVGQPLDTKLALTDETDNLAVAPKADRSTLINQALEHRPEALESTVELLAAKKGIQIARTTSAPGLALSLSGTRYPTTSFVQPRQNVGAITLSLNVPIFDGGLARDKVSEARSYVSTVEARQDRIRRDIALEVQNASLDVETAIKRETAAEAEVKAAASARKLAQQRFESQVGLYIEVTDAQSALTAAQAAKVQATYDLLTARARLAHAVGAN